MLKNLLSDAFKKNNYKFSDEIQNQIILYLELLTKWNKAYNLTAITQPKEMVYLHILDSLSVQPFLHGEKILDVGTGAGLPGLPLALINPEKKFVLLDSNGKKTRFLTQAMFELNIKNIEVVQSRSEDFHPTICFDTILSRAFATLANMIESTQHLICQHGHFVAMKGAKPSQEIAELPNEVEVIATQKLNIKGLDADRHIIVIQKTEHE